MNLYDILGPETKEREYKQVVLKSLFSNNKASKIILGNKSYYHELYKNLYKQIQKDLLKYFPKYLSSFINSSTNGELLYGVTDDGIVYGFPWEGEFNIDMIKLLLKEQLYNDDIISNVDKKYIWDNCIDIKLEKLDKKKSLEELKLKGNTGALLYYNNMNEHKEYKKNINRYIRLKKIYRETIALFTQKLEVIMTNKETRKILLEYIYKRTDYKTFRILKKKIINKDYPSLLNSGDIIEYKKNITSPYYWVTRFKDDYVDMYSTIFKIKKPYRIYKTMEPSMIVSLLEPLYTNLCNTANLYVIRLKFYSSKNITISYKKNGKILSPKREIMRDGSPCCNPN